MGGWRARRRLSREGIQGLEGVCQCPLRGKDGCYAGLSVGRGGVSPFAVGEEQG